MKVLLSSLLISTSSVGRSAAFVGLANAGLGVRSIHRSNDFAHTPPTIYGLPSTGLLRVDDRRSKVVSHQARAKFSPLKMSVDKDLVFGYAIIAMAMSPYLLQIIFPKFLDKKFFMPVYKTGINKGDDAREAESDNAREAREAEIGWKTRFSALSFGITTLNAIQVLTVHNITPAKMLRDSFTLWIVFYVDAILKVRREAKQGILAAGHRVGYQAWHCTVVLGLLLNLLAKDGNIFQQIIEFIMKSKIVQALPITWLLKWLGLES